MKNKSLETIFRQKLENLRIEPTDRAKNLILQKIKKRGRIILYRRLSVAASILLVTSLGIIYLMPGINNTSLIQQKEAIGEIRDLSQEKDTPEKREVSKVPQVTQSLPRNNTEEQPMERVEEVKAGGAEESDHVISNNAGEYKNISLALISKEKSEQFPVPDSLHIASLKDQPSLNISPGLEKKPDSLLDEIHHTDQVAVETKKDNEPMKITIEYIASGSKKNVPRNPITHAGGLYSKVNKLVYPDEILGDLRSLKDQLFALDFINRKSNETQNIKEK